MCVVNLDIKILSILALLLCSMLCLDSTKVMTKEIVFVCICDLPVCLRTCMQGVICTLLLA